MNPSGIAQYFTQSSDLDPNGVPYGPNNLRPNAFDVGAFLNSLTQSSDLDPIGVPYGPNNLRPNAFDVGAFRNSLTQSSDLDPDGVPYGPDNLRPNALTFNGDAMLMPQTGQSTFYALDNLILPHKYSEDGEDETSHGPATHLKTDRYRPPLKRQRLLHIRAGDFTVLHRAQTLTPLRYLIRC